MPRKATRRLLAWLLAVCVLFAQTAALAYACAVDGAVAAQAAAVAPCPEHVADVDADGEAQEASLCKIHCQTPMTPDTGVSLPMAAAVEARPRVIAAIFDSLDRVPEAPTPRGAPPPVLRVTSRLLI
jgi:hypothetical protein